MSKQKFDPVVKMAVYETYDKKCFYCGESVGYRNVQIDHYIPESAIDLPGFIEAFGLAPDFLPTNIENLVVSCQGCNLSKLAKVAHLRKPRATFEIEIILSKKKRLHDLLARWTREVATRPLKDRIFGHFVRTENDKLTEIFVLSEDSLYRVLVRHENGVEFAFVTDFTAEKAEFHAAPILDDYNETYFSQYVAYFEHFGDAILVVDQFGAYGHMYPESPMFSGIYRRTAYTHSIF